MYLNDDQLFQVRGNAVTVSTFIAGMAEAGVQVITSGRLAKCTSCPGSGLVGPPEPVLPTLLPGVVRVIWFLLYRDRDRDGHCPQVDSIAEYDVTIDDRVYANILYAFRLYVCDCTPGRVRCQLVVDSVTKQRFAISAPHRRDQGIAVISRQRRKLDRHGD